MPFRRPGLARHLPRILAPLLACSAVRAQIHEEKPAPGLEEGVLIDVKKDGINSNGSPVPRTGRPGDKDFSIVIEAGITDLADAALFWDFDWARGWLVDLKADGSIQFTGKGATPEEIKIISQPHSIKPHQKHCIVVSTKRNARQPESGIWIDGIEVASGAVPPVDCGGFQICRSDTEKLTSLRVREYNRALTRPEILELFLRGSRREEAQTSGSAASSTPNAQKSVPPHVGSYEFPKLRHPAPPPNGPRFIPQPDETIALIGGTEAVAIAESGELEALLLMAFPQTRFHFRSLAWEGDTVFKQDRPMNFGSLEQQLRRVNASAVFVMFGRQESLDAGKDEGGRMKDEKSQAAADSSFIPHPSSLNSFKTAFEKLLATVEKVTPNIVVIGPPPFEKKAPPLPDVSAKNKDLNVYSEAMRAVAEKRAATFIEINPADDAGKKSSELTSDGVQLTPKGAAQIVKLMSGKLDNPPYVSSNIRMILPSKTVDSLLGKTADPFIRDAVRTKNRLWHDYWRPSNWAFLHGDRTNQPSSRDPVNPQIRFFPAEQEKYLPLIQSAEDKVFQLVQEAQKKLP